MGDYQIAHLPPPASVGAAVGGREGKIARGVKHFHCTERTGEFPLWNVGTAAGMGGFRVLPPAVPFLPAAEGDVPCPRARVTFGRSPKSDQKRCLKPQVSRLPARLGCAENRGRVPRENQDSADRRTTNRLYVSPRCRCRVLRGDALVYRLCGGVLACRFTKCVS